MKNLFQIPLDGRRVYGLDILRTLAILFVVYSHGKHIIKDVIPIDYYSIPVIDGVGIFFVLSGFLIGRILIKTLMEKGTDKYTLVNFWIRRWFRTLPNYFFILFLLIFLANIFKNLNEPFTFSFLFFTQNLATPHPDVFPEAWSLAVEEWFYLLTPLPLFFLCRLFDRNKRAVILTVIVLFILSISAFRIIRLHQLPINSLAEWSMYFDKQVITRLSSIMFGVLGAYIFTFFPKVFFRFKYSLLALGIMLIIGDKLIFTFREELGLSFGLYFAEFHFTVLSVGTLFLFPFFQSWQSGKGSVYRAITRISLISYSMYLINLTLIQKFILPIFLSALPDLFSGAGLAIFTYVMYWSFTIGISVLLYKYIEIPFMNLRSYFGIKRVRTIFRHFTPQLNS